MRGSIYRKTLRDLRSAGFEDSISDTAKPAPRRRHSWRNGRSVKPAIGDNPTGQSVDRNPCCPLVFVIRWPVSFRCPGGALRSSAPRLRANVGDRPAELNPQVQHNAIRARMD